MRRTQLLSAQQLSSITSNSTSNSISISNGVAATMSTDEDGGSWKDSKKRCARIRVLLSLRTHIARVVLLLMLLLLVAFLVLFGSPHTNDKASTQGTVTGTSTKGEAALSSNRNSNSESQTDFTKLGNCTFASPPSRKEWTTKPLWFPSFPSTIEDNVYKSLVATITGLPAGAKSFYASNKGLRQCFGTTETAACLNIHPIVEMTPGPAAKAPKFHSNIVLSLRNPTTVLPAFLNAKRIKYAKLPGQQPENEWRQARDQHIDGLMEQYRKFLHTWKHQPPYHVAMYVVVEDLMQNPAPVQQLATVLQSAGFSVADPEDMECIWFQGVGGSEALEHFHQHRYEFHDYLPGYTEAQRDMFLRQLTEMIQDYKDDGALVKILQRYHDDIRDMIRLDHPWVNETATL